MIKGQVNQLITFSKKLQGNKTKIKQNKKKPNKQKKKTKPPNSNKKTQAKTIASDERETGD